MDKAKGLCVERLARTYLEAVFDELAVAAGPIAAQYLKTSVTPVGKQRMADMPHVRPYLMGTPCLEYALYKRNIAEPLYYAVMGYGVLAYPRVRRKHSHAHPVFKVSADVALNAPLIFGKITPDQGIVTAVGGLVEN